MPDDNGNNNKENGDQASGGPTIFKFHTHIDPQPFENIAQAINAENEERNKKTERDKEFGDRQVTAQEKGNVINKWSLITNIGVSILTLVALYLNWLSMTQIKNQFKIDNEPYLQIIKPIVYSLNPNEPPIIQYDIINLGKQPVKEIKSWDAIQFVRTADVQQFIDSPFKYIQPNIFPNSRYFTRETPLTTPFVSNFITSKGQVDSVRNGTIQLFLTGSITYFNSISQEQKIYKFCINFRPNSDTAKQFPIVSYHYIVNDN